jgi:pimeloyl-ACP methyl ester carboxylesterase
MSEPPHAFAEGYVDAAGDRIHYVERGSGSPLLLIHGAYGSGTRFVETDFGTTLGARYRVIAPDSLAHGDSDKPADPSRYGARRRAFHLAAVLDALGIERLPVVGYSMGGWMASALATFHPERVASLVIGGWDVVNGMYTPAAAWGLPKITGEILNALARRDHPELLDWVRPEHEAGLIAAVDGMNDLTGLAEGVSHCPARVALWMGREDLYYDAAVRFAAANSLPLIELPGDHISTLEQHGVEAARRVSDFIEEAARDVDAAPVAGRL